ncbi:hypothetical protein EOA27_09635 [Mesorhizobium sp. M2A.F.Ca.ET.037.01.1.1]|uniref:hypothetical protein n=1 Tax=Mesorhizobium sp. M2A.F.Ca.ET.037.01.1.1 TaxID=2496748 RepID=UPI000FC99999|nr:hypothetical protein [Mesorhizobium sp. M2A.F.Ca.ET.037.01.1.1]RUX20026.1 hypothetical protein EOA27_09635 [Mesorhizobium sp. M2A.F.Ca.ET.037.01.1.1]
MDIIRDMIVADRGSPRQFRKGPLPEDVGPDTIGRLRRAGALPAIVLDEADNAAIDAFAQLIETAPARKGKTK